MNSAIFNTPKDSFTVSNINYAGPVSAIPSERRKGEYTHSFKIITTLKSEFCYFNNEETAKKARGALTGMMDVCKPIVYKHGFETLDTRQIVSFSKVVTLKNTLSGHTHAVVLTIACASEKNNEVWLRYRSEENAQKGRRALAAAIHASNMLIPPCEEDSKYNEISQVAK